MAESKTFDFSNRRIKALPPQLPNAAANAAAYSDSGVSGLKLEVTKANRKTFIFRFVLDGQRGYARIGEFPAVDVAEARKAAMEMKGQVERGLNPNDVRDRAHAVIPTSGISRWRNSSPTSWRWGSGPRKMISRN
ncbi:Arm DNA-binding domain-containing protein [Zoogloea ramigera]|uniref:Arm DNA-binding domain-containing protein n=1 Tax=Zoogloea ramigera TaxID=350 RepID=UPI003FA2B7B5